MGGTRGSYTCLQLPRLGNEGQSSPGLRAGEDKSRGNERVNRFAACTSFSSASSFSLFLLFRGLIDFSDDDDDDFGFWFSLTFVIIVRKFGNLHPSFYDDCKNDLCFESESKLFDVSLSPFLFLFYFVRYFILLDVR